MILITVKKVGFLKNKFQFTITEENDSKYILRSQVFSSTNDCDEGVRSFLKAINSLGGVAFQGTDLLHFATFMDRKIEESKD